MHLLQKVLPCINKFLKTCNIEEIKLIDQSCEDATNITEAVGILCADLSDIHNTENSDEEHGSSITQITASDSELKERIKAFMKHSQSKIDEQNVKEFCTTPQQIQEWGCARTDSTYKRRSSHTMHIQVTKVVNSDGPQLQFTSSGNHARPGEGNSPIRESCKPPHPVEERLQNIESHLNINSSQASDVYFRIKKLEDRLLAMEGSSPEYNFRHVAPITARQMSREDPQDYSLEEIDERVRQLKQSLLAKKRKMDFE